MKETLSLVAIVQDGSPALSEGQRDRMAAFYARRDGKYVQVSIREQGRPRSLNQNAYMWGVVYQMIADETGHTTEEVHEFCKMKFLPRKFVAIAGDEYSITKSTATLSTDEMEEYLTQVRVFAATELSLTIPLPNES